MRIREIFTKNVDFQQLAVLRTNRNKRHKRQVFLIEGVRNINQAVKNGWGIASFVFASDKPKSNWAREMIHGVETDINYELTGTLMKELSGKDETSELMAVVKMREISPNQLELSENPILAMFDRPSNKGNMGSIIRSCDALGVEVLVITGHAVDIYDPDTVVSTMGSFFNLPIIQLRDNSGVEVFISEMKDRYPGFITVGTSAHAKTSMYDVDMRNPMMLMIGNETKGLSHNLQEICDISASIPMDESSSASSLNVACAATVMFYEASRQRRSICQS